MLLRCVDPRRDVQRLAIAIVTKPFMASREAAVHNVSGLRWCLTFRPY